MPLFAMTQFFKGFEFLMLLLVLTFPQVLSGQGFVKTFGGAFNQVGYGIAELENGEIVVVAQEVDDPTQPHFIANWYRLDGQGELISKRKYYGFAMVIPEKMISLGVDRFVIVGGSDRSASLNPFPFVAAFDADGKEQWKVLFDHLNGDSNSVTYGKAMDVDTVPGGGVLVTAETFGIPPHLGRSNLVKLDVHGNIEWIKQDTGIGYGNYAYSVVDGAGFMYTAITTRIAFAEPDKVVLSKRTPEGTVLWRKILDIDPQYSTLGVNDLLLDRDGNLVLGGYSIMENEGQGLMLLKFSPEGQKLIEAHHREEGWKDTQFRDFEYTGTGDLLIVGGVVNPGDQHSPFGYYDAFWANAGPNLQIKDLRLHNATANSHEYFNAIRPSGDHDFLMVGAVSQLSGNVSTEVLIARLNCYGETADKDFSGQSIDLVAYPVPSGGMVMLSAESDELCLDRISDLTIEVYNAKGQMIAVDWHVVTGKIILDFSNTAPGHYFVRFKSATGEILNKKITISR